MYMITDSVTVLFRINIYISGRIIIVEIVVTKTLANNILPMIEHDPNKAPGS